MRPTLLRGLTLAVIISVWSTKIVLSQLQTQTCSNVPTTYSVVHGNWSISRPNFPSYTDGTIPPYHLDSNDNLIVTWPHAGSGTYYVFVDTPFDPLILQVSVTIGPEINFSSMPSTLCHGQSGTFTIVENCNGNSFNWIAPQGWSINGGANTLLTSSLTVNISAPASGTGSAQITVISNYGSVASTSVWVGSPIFNSISVDGSTSPVPLCGSGNYIGYTTGQAHVLSTTVSGTSSVAFALSGSGASEVTGSAISATSYQFASSSSTANFSITATASNSCNTISQCLPFYNVSGGGGGGGGCSLYAVSPNPSSTTLRVVVPNRPPPCNSTQSSTNLLSSQLSPAGSETSGNENTLTIQSVSVYSLDGQPQYTKQFSDNAKSADLDISGLKKGVYILKISDGVSHHEAQRIIIN
jgi:hypothetical protein